MFRIKWWYWSAILSLNVHFLSKCETTERAKFEVTGFQCTNYAHKWFSFSCIVVLLVTWADLPHKIKGTIQISVVDWVKLILTLEIYFFLWYLNISSLWIQNYTYDLLSFHYKVNNFHSGNPNKGSEMSYNVALRCRVKRGFRRSAGAREAFFSLYLSSKMRLVKIQVLINFEINTLQIG